MMAASVLALVMAAASAAFAAAAPATSRVLDDFEGPLVWTAQPADGVVMSLHEDTGANGRGMRIDYGFAGGGYAIARREIGIDLPANYELSFRLRGEGAPNTLEFKLVDPSGENVWWSVRREVDWPQEWTPFRYKTRHITFAWGPRGGGVMERVGSLEIVVTAGTGGGKGSVWIDDLEFRELPPASDLPYAPRGFASSARPGRGAKAALDGRRGTAWSPRGDDPAPWIALDFNVEREFGGLVLEWAPDRHAMNYRVETSPDGAAWTTLRRVQGSRGGTDPLVLPESDARFVRIAIEDGPASDAGSPAPSAEGASIALRRIEVKPLAWSATREAFAGALAKEAPRGLYPRGISGEQTYWTVIGGERDGEELLFSEDGALELGMGEGTIEPFLFVEGRLVTWADATISRSLEDGVFPIPTVTWEADGLRLEVTAWDEARPASGTSGAPPARARYRVTNTRSRAVDATLFLAIRPFQVNPPSQWLNLHGGTAPIRSIARAGSTVYVNGGATIVLGEVPDVFGATTFDGGDIVADDLIRGEVPPATAVEDSSAAASGALGYRLQLGAGESDEMTLAVMPRPARGAASTGAAASFHSAANDGADSAAGALRSSADAWRERLGPITFDLPEPAASWARAFRSQIAFILINRDGSAIQPGARSYARSWIRDGALTSSAMLRAGRPDVARDFLRWFAPHQYEDGKIPCVVDSRGADPVPEHDSHGEFIYLTAEIVRFTQDRELAAEMMPRVLAAAAYLDTLRATRRTPEFADPARHEFYGLLPPSISHEGYSAKPMHSYWDDFFAVRGYRDAIWLAEFLGRDEDRRRLEASAAEFEADLAASVPRAMERHDIDYIPGCADLGDFDATSTTIALTPTNAAHLLPAGALEATFDRYWANFEARRRGDPWEAYTPYEFRTIGSLVRLGRREDALAAMEWFVGHMRPLGWNAWPEVVRRDEREAVFLGDLPHTWVGSDFMRSFLDLFVYEDEATEALVVGAGVDEAWLRRPEGITFRGLQTRWGTVDVTMRREGAGIVTTLGGSAAPPAGVIVLAPGMAPASAASIPATVRSGR